MTSLGNRIVADVINLGEAGGAGLVSLEKGAIWTSVRENSVKTHGDNGHVQARERPNPPLEGPNPGDLVISEFQPPL